MSSNPPGSSLPPDHGPEFEAILEAFDDAWQTGPPPSIDDYHRPASAYHADLLRELVQIDLERRLRTPGLDGRAEDYFRRYPELSADKSFVFALIRVEHKWRLARGETVRREEYYGRFPQYRDELTPHLIASTAQPATQPYPRVPAAAPTDVLPQIPGFEILGLLGRGSMGVVYKARDVQLGRTVALKMLLHGGLAGTDLFDRFAAEARVVAALAHPNIVQVFQLDTHEGLPFLALEFVAGGTLADRLAGEPLPPTGAAELVETLARAMQHAHEKGVVHRDLKPANILLQRGFTAEGAEDAEEKQKGKQAARGGEAPPLGSVSSSAPSAPSAVNLLPKITDFGLAKRLDGDAGRTQTGAVVGTPAYMAPEQAEGRIRDVGPPADIYALGVILYQAIIGRPPFFAASSHEVLELVRTTEPPPPRSVQPGVPRDLETVCLKCLEKEPARRYATAGELADDLRRFQNGEPVRARRPWPWERLAKWARRRPSSAALVGVLLLVVAGLVAAGLWFEADRRERAAEALRATVGHLAAGRVALSGDDLAAWSDAEHGLQQARKIIRDWPELRRLEGDVEDIAEQLGRKIAQRKAAAEARGAAADARAQRTQFRNLRNEALLYLHVSLLRRQLSLAALAPPSAPEDSLELDRFKLPRDSALAETRPSGPLEDPLLTDETKGLQTATQAWRTHEELLALLVRYPDALNGKEQRQHQADVRELIVAAARVQRQAPARAVPGVWDFGALVKTLPGTDGDTDAFLRGLAHLSGRVDPAAAVAELNRAVAKREDHVTARFLRAAVNLDRNLPVAAYEDLSRCVALEPTFAWARILRGYAQGLLASGSSAEQARLLYQGAERDFNEALPSTDVLARYAALNARGVVRYLLARADEGRVRQALEDFETARAIPVRPGLVSAHVNLAHALEARKQYPEALAALAGAEVPAADDRAEVRRLRAGLHRTRARLLLKQKDSDRALEELRAAIREDSPNRNRSEAVRHTLAHDHLECAFVLLARKDYAAALEDCDAALDLRAGFAEAHYLRANVLLQLRQYDRAAEAYEQAATAYAPSVERVGERTTLLLQRRAEVLERQGLVLTEYLGRHAEAVDCLSRARQPGLTDEMDRRLRSGRGWAALASGAVELAEADFKEAVRRKPNDPEARIGLACASALLPGRSGTAAHEVRQGIQEWRRQRPEWLKAEPHAVANVRVRLRACHLYYHAARVYVRRMDRLDHEGPLTDIDRKRRDEYATQAELLLRAVAEEMRDWPEAERAAYVNDRLARDAALAPLLHAPNGVLRNLRREFGVRAD